MKKTFFCLLSLILYCNLAFAQERSVRKKSEQTAATETRLALIIGNSDYLQTARLRNPVNDARSISKTLRDLGFSVTTLENADKRGMDSAIRKFGKTLRKEGGVGLFYYASHGMQIRGENYLLPVDINPSTETDVSYDAVPLGKLLGQMKMADNGMNVVILDACRNNPFARSFRSNSSGLAQVIAPSGTFIAYATAPGSLASDRTGSNDLYT
ncbi:MAG TPA: caspase family protein [Candidatus Lambdaproteobacteria bacterium]|nr:caspase family protein [Candidatus Lambdaproteobacteria bacterium]